jgi:hypothetical protein
MVALLPPLGRGVKSRCKSCLGGRGEFAVLVLTNSLCCLSFFLNENSELDPRCQSQSLLPCVCRKRLSNRFVSQCGISIAQAKCAVNPTKDAILCTTLVVDGVPKRDRRAGPDRRTDRSAAEKSRYRGGLKRDRKWAAALGHQQLTSTAIIESKTIAQRGCSRILECA